ncbi:hypothetical protein GCM10025777_57420 [Membranihabitans marinus]
MLNKDKFLALVSQEKTDTIEKIKWRIQNRDWLERSQDIALKILQILREKNMSQKDLAQILDVSPQQVNKWVKGKENFRLDTISKLENALGTELIKTNAEFDKNNLVKEEI